MAISMLCEMNTRQLRHNNEKGKRNFGKGKSEKFIETV